MKTLRKHLQEIAAQVSTMQIPVRVEVTTPYLEKRALFPAQISGQPAADLEMIVVIPAKDEPKLLKSLEALRKAKDIKGSIEIIVVINDSEADSTALQKRNERLFAKAIKWAVHHSQANKKFHILYHSDLPAKYAGVGLARKIGMDEAVYRLEEVGNKKGLILCYDADTLCQPNYFQAVQAYFKAHPKCQAASIYYEHPLNGEEHPKKVYRAIALYELHLRYYILAQRYAGFPYAFETIGSAMVVRTDAYQAQGGMNKRKAGEDFYFLHKYTILGHFGEIKTTILRPSPRRSDRVPFGTGKAVADIAARPKELVKTYSPRSFEDLKALFDKVLLLRKWNTKGVKVLESYPKSIQDFLKSVEVEKNIKEIISNTSNAGTFRRRFYRWFNAFMIMKYLHFARDRFYENVPVEEAAAWLLKVHLRKRVRKGAGAATLLRQLRNEL